MKASCFSFEDMVLFLTYSYLWSFFCLPQELGSSIFRFHFILQLLHRSIVVETPRISSLESFSVLGFLLHSPVIKLAESKPLFAQDQEKHLAETSSGSGYIGFVGRYLIASSPLSYLAELK